MSTFEEEYYENRSEEYTSSLKLSQIQSLIIYLN